MPDESPDESPLPNYQTRMEMAILDFIRAHGKVPTVILLGDDIWRERADVIAADMNRTGPKSEVEVHRLPPGINGVVCA